MKVTDVIIEALPSLLSHRPKSHDDRIVYGHESGDVIKETKRLEHIVDELNNVVADETWTPSNVDPKIMSRFLDAVDDLTEIAQRMNQNEVH